MKKVVVAAVLFAVVAAFSVSSFGVRAEVAREKVIARIDSMLGSMDVKRKEIEVSVVALQEGLTQLRKAKIKSQVKHDQIGRKVAAAENNVDTTDRSLKTLREQLASGSAVNLAGTTYTVAELNQVSKRVIRQRQEYAQQLSGFDMAKSRLQRVVSTLEAKQSNYESKLADIEHQLAVIDSNRLALNAIKDAAKAMTGSEESLSGNVAQLEEQVNDLYADVEAELISEDAEWQGRESSRLLTTQDEIIQTMQTADDTIGEINAILSETQLADASK